MTASPAVRVLSFHADYACRHSGRCCTSSWPIPVAPDAASRIRRALGVTGIDHTPDGALLLGRAHGACVFHDRDASGGCRIQRTLGHEALPLACRQFPRQSLTDPRGTSMTLSHYCPTARGQLDTASGPVTIRTNAPGFPAGGEYVGLDAAPDFPPLLHPTCLLDWESWWRIEAHAVALLGADAETVLPRLQSAVEELRTWQPSTGHLLDVVDRAFDRVTHGSWPAWAPADALVAAHARDVRDAIPGEWRDDADRALAVREPPLAEPVLGRFLAAHAFANWAAYQGRGLRTWYRSIEAAGCLARLTGDPGAVDLLVRHLADSSALITRWSRSESAPATRRT